MRIARSMFSPDLLHALQIWWQPPMAAEDLLVHWAKIVFWEIHLLCITLERNLWNFHRGGYLVQKIPWLISEKSRSQGCYIAFQIYNQAVEFDFGIYQDIRWRTNCLMNMMISEMRQCIGRQSSILIIIKVSKISSVWSSKNYDFGHQEVRWKASKEWSDD